MVDSILRRVAWILVALLFVIASIGHNFKSNLLAQPGDKSIGKEVTAFHQGQKKQLPSLEHGGIIFFLHVPKGTVMRSQWVAVSIGRSHMPYHSAQAFLTRTSCFLQEVGPLFANSLNINVEGDGQR